MKKKGKDDINIQHIKGDLASNLAKYYPQTDANSY